MRFYHCLLGMLITLLPLAVSAQTHNMALLASTCAACHGTEGHSQGGTPSLAGLDELYFIKQMHDFQSGKRSATVMQQQAAGLSDAEISALATYFAKQK